MPRWFRLRGAVAAIAALMIAVSLWHLEGARRGLTITGYTAGKTPVTLYRANPQKDAPLIVVSHGFAGSRQLMAAYSLTLAQAGYSVAAFDFQGHGRNPVAMSGDVTSVDGTTRYLIAETRKVIDSALERTGATGQIGILGHSMASDIIIRTALADRRIGPVVAISPFSQAVTATEPRVMAMVSGAWEAGLRQFAREQLRKVNPGAEEGETTIALVNGSTVLRRAVAAPNVEHVAVLYSPTALLEAVAWFDRYFGRRSAASNDPEAVADIGGWILLLLSGIVIAAWPLAGMLPLNSAARDYTASTPLPWRAYGMILAVPAVVTPMIAVLTPQGWLPVLVADYLAVHFLIYGLIQLFLLRRWGVPLRCDAGGIIALAAFGIGVFGMALDRYVANFVPPLGRLPVVAALTFGALPFMMADRMLAHAAGGFWRGLLTKVALFASLGIALALDFERLFFLVLIIPVMILFFLIFGLMGQWVGERRGPATAGIGLGLLLGWALGVTFPLFSS